MKCFFSITCGLILICQQALGNCISATAQFILADQASLKLKPGTDAVLKFIEGNVAMSKDVIYVGRTEGAFEFHQTGTFGVTGKPVVSEKPRYYFVDKETGQLIFADVESTHVESLGQVDHFKITKATCQGPFGSCAAHGTFHFLGQLAELGLLPKNVIEKMESEPFSHLYELIHSKVNSLVRAGNQDQAIGGFLDQLGVGYVRSTDAHVLRAHLDNGLPVLFSANVRGGKRLSTTHIEGGVGRPEKLAVPQLVSPFFGTGGHQLIAMGRIKHPTLGPLWIIRNSWEGGTIALVPEKHVLNSFLGDVFILKNVPDDVQIRMRATWPEYFENKSYQATRFASRNGKTGLMIAAFYVFIHATPKLIKLLEDSEENESKKKLGLEPEPVPIQ